MQSCVRAEQSRHETGPDDAESAPVVVVFGFKTRKRLHGGGKGKGVRKFMVVGVKLVESRKDFGGRR